VFEDLAVFVKQVRGLQGTASQQADDARRLTADEVIAWRDAKLTKLSPKTVKDVYVASLKSVLGRAVEDRKLSENVAANVKVRMSAAPVLRERGFTESEATAILKVCKDYAPLHHDNPANRESTHVTAAKRWGPWLCALSGARVGEILQLRKSDVRQAENIHFLHITPEAGTVKARMYRDVPIHPQLIDLGFMDFVARSEDGPLFYAHSADPAKLPAQAVSTRVAKWLQGLNLVPDGVSPNHGWRHRFKTLSREAGLDPRVVDGIQGHTGRTASDGYGDVTLRTKTAAIEKLPFYKL
jgi:integrase